jgi:hypothetical protein
MTTTNRVLKTRKIELEVKALKSHTQPTQPAKSYFPEAAVDGDGAD